ncbi:MAG: hypothetical protein Q9157_004820 [Trypethelium eluteriae]
MALLPRQTTLPVPYVVPASQQFDGDKGSWSTFSISVGSPPQDFRLLVSTAASDTWVPIAGGCTQYDLPNCPQLRGVELFNGAQTSGFESNQSSTWSLVGLYAVQTEQHLNITGNGLHGYDTVHLGSSQDTSALSVEHSVVAAIPDLDIFLGQLGLGIQPVSFSSASTPVPSLLQSLRNNNQIPSLSFGYTAGNPYRLKKVDGSLILGGYDSTRFAPNNVSFTFAGNDASALTVGVQSIITSDSLHSTQAFTSTGHLSVIDSTVDELWLPGDVCDSMADAFGLIHDPESDLYVLNDTIHSQLQQINPNITFQLGNTAYNTGNSVNIVLPYSAFDMQASWPIFQSSFNYFPIRRAANDTQYTIGRTLLQEAYLVVDYEHQNFSLSQAVWPDPLPSSQIEIIQPSSAASATSTNGPSAKSLGTGAIAGIAVGGAVVLLLIAFGAFLFFRRRRRPHKHQAVPSGSNVSPDYKPGFDGQNNSANNPNYQGSSYFGPERKDTLHGQQHAQELHGNEYGEMDGQGWMRSELPASKPGDVSNGRNINVYEMSADTAGTWNSRQSLTTGTLGSQTGTQGTWAPSPPPFSGSFHPSRSTSQNGSQWGSDVFEPSDKAF